MSYCAHLMEQLKLDYSPALLQCFGLSWIDLGKPWVSPA